jgi:transposase
MRGEDRQQVAMFSYISVEQRVPQEHPLRVMWVLSDAVLKDLSRKFSRLYSHTGRPSIPPEKLLRALLLQCPVLDSKRETADGAAPLQPSVPMVCRLGHG